MLCCLPFSSSISFSGAEVCIINLNASICLVHHSVTLFAQNLITLQLKIFYVADKSHKSIWLWPYGHWSINKHTDLRACMNIWGCIHVAVHLWKEYLSVKSMKWLIFRFFNDIYFSSSTHTWDAFHLALASFELYCVQNNQVLPFESHDASSDIGPHLIGNCLKINVDPPEVCEDDEESSSGSLPAIKIHDDEVNLRFLICGAPSSVVSFCWIPLVLCVHYIVNWAHMFMLYMIHIYLFHTQLHFQ